MLNPLGEIRAALKILIAMEKSAIQIKAVYQWRERKGWNWSFSKALLSAVIPQLCLELDAGNNYMDKETRAWDNTLLVFLISTVLCFNVTFALSSNWGDKKSSEWECVLNSSFLRD